MAKSKSTVTSLSGVTSQIVSYSDLRALSFVPVIRDKIEDSAKQNIRGLIEDSPKTWLRCLSEALADCSTIASAMAERHSDHSDS